MEMLEATVEAIILSLLIHHHLLYKGDDHASKGFLEH